MNMRDYYSDKLLEERRLRDKHPNGVVFVTSVFNRDRSSVAGQTLSATCSNAARVITDGTHRESTKDEIKAFITHQQQQKVSLALAEQKNKQQYVMVVDRKATPQELASVMVGGGDDEDDDDEDAVSEG